MVAFVDRALAARIEAVEVTQLSSLARLVKDRRPETSAEARAVAGGVAVYVGRANSLSRAVGLGMSGPVSAEDADALVDHYASREMDARILVSPYADASLYEHLGARGFALSRFDSVLTRRVEPAASAPLDGAVTVTIAGPEDAARWVRASLDGFGVPEGPAARESAAIFEVAFALPGVTYFLSSIGGALAGAAAVYVHERTAYFFAASTAAAHRGRGAQAALIKARLAFAREAGCDLAFTATAPGSGSQRNFERAGFATAYSQAMLVRRFAGR